MKTTFLFVKTLILSFIFISNGHAYREGRFNVDHLRQDLLGMKDFIHFQIMPRSKKDHKKGRIGSKTRNLEKKIRNRADWLSNHVVNQINSGFRRRQIYDDYETKRHFQELCDITLSLIEQYEYEHTHRLLDLHYTLYERYITSIGRAIGYHVPVLRRSNYDRDRGYNDRRRYDDHHDYDRKNYRYDNSHYDSHNRYDNHQSHDVDVRRGHLVHPNVIKHGKPIVGNKIRVSSGPAFVGSFKKKNYKSQVKQFSIGNHTAGRSFSSITLKVSVTEKHPPILNTVKVRHNGKWIASTHGSRLANGHNSIGINIPQGADKLVLSFDHGKGSQVSVSLI